MTTTPPSADRKGYKDLPDSAKAACNSFMSESVLRKLYSITKWRAYYAAIYWGYK